MLSINDRDYLSFELNFVQQAATTSRSIPDYGSVIVFVPAQDVVV